MSPTLDLLLFPLEIGRITLILWKVIWSNEEEDKHTITHSINVPLRREVSRCLGLVELGHLGEYGELWILLSSVLLFRNAIFPSDSIPVHRNTNSRSIKDIKLNYQKPH